MIPKCGLGRPFRYNDDSVTSKGMKPTSLSSIEKRFNQIKESLGFTKNEQLIAYCKDREII